MICPRWVDTRVTADRDRRRRHDARRRSASSTPPRRDPARRRRRADLPGDDAALRAPSPALAAADRQRPGPLTPRLSSHWVRFVTPVGRRLAKPLVDGLRSETVVEERAAGRPQRPPHRLRRRGPGGAGRRMSRWASRASARSARRSPPSPACPLARAGCCAARARRGGHRRPRGPHAPRRRRRGALGPGGAISDARGRVDEIWNPLHLERLARTYWRFLTRVRSASSASPTRRPSATSWSSSRGRSCLLSFQAPEYEMDDDRGIVRWRIEQGPARGPARARRRRLPGDRRPPLRARSRGRRAARASRRGRGRELLPGDRLRHRDVVLPNTQSRIHVIVTHGFLRSLARLDLAESRVGRFAAPRVHDPPGPASTRVPATAAPGSAVALAGDLAQLRAVVRRRMRRTVPERDRMTSDSVDAPLTPGSGRPGARRRR